MDSLLASFAAPLLLFGTGPEGVQGPDSVELVKNGTVRPRAECELRSCARVRCERERVQRGSEARRAHGCGLLAVHSLVFGKDRSLRPGYGKFLREGAKGKISLGASSEALGLSIEELESGWHAYVQENAR